MTFGLSSCGKADKKFDASKIACDKVASELDKAESSVDDANEAVKNAKADTPDVKEAQNALKDAENKVKSLKDRQTACPNGDESEATCPNSWAMNKSLPANGDWVPQVPSIKPGLSEAKARAAANDWIELTKKHPATLEAAAVALHVLPYDHKVKQGDLVKDGCATLKAKQLVKASLQTLAASKITSEDAPTDGTNSGTKDGDVSYYGESGVDGDRTAIKIDPPVGSTLWVMHRCGNVVTHNPPPPPKPECPPNSDKPECLTPKDPSKDVNVNPDVPDGVKGPGTTPVGTDPGPPTTPVDSDTGCKGSCPGTKPTPTPTPNPPGTVPTPIVSNPPATGNPPEPPSD